MSFINMYGRCLVLVVFRLLVYLQRAFQRMKHMYRKDGIKVKTVKRKLICMHNFDLLLFLYIGTTWFVNFFFFISYLNIFIYCYFLVPEWSGDFLERHTTDSQCLTSINHGNGKNHDILMCYP